MIINKISFKKWLNTKNKYNYTNNYQLVTILFTDLSDYIENHPEISLNTDNESFFNYFIKFVYNEHAYPINKMIYNTSYKLDEEYIENENYIKDYFIYKYSEEITDLFIEFKKISYNNNLNIFHNKYDTSYPLIEFIFYNCDIEDFYNNNNIETIEDTINIYEY